MSQDSSALSSTSCLFSSTHGSLPQKVQFFPWRWALCPNKPMIFSLHFCTLFSRTKIQLHALKRKTVILPSLDGYILTFGLKSIKWLFEFTGNNLYRWFRGNMVMFLKKRKIGTCKIYQGYSSETPGSFFCYVFFTVADKTGVVYL